MKFSIIVPVYNVENYIKQCVDSIIGQFYQNFELILVDDGSIDFSGNICDDYQRAYPEKVTVIHKDNQGVLAARIDGIKSAKGEFCVFVDSDDFIEPHLLSTIDDYLNRDIEVDVLLYSFIYNRNGKKDNRFKIVAEDGYIWEGEEKKQIYEKISTTFEITSIWTKAIRTSILKQDDTDYRQYYGKNMAEDLLHSLYSLTVARKIMYTDKTLYNYRINDESLSRSFRVETLDKKNTIFVYEKILEYLKIWDMDTYDMKQRVNAKWFNEAIYMISRSYEESRCKFDRQAVLQYDWNRLIPLGIIETENEYENEVYKKLYNWWTNKDYRRIQRYFVKKKYYQMIKKLKRKLLK